MKPAFFACLALSVFFIRPTYASATQPNGEWPEPRQNAHLTAMQPLAADINAAPLMLARLDLGRGSTPLSTFWADDGKHAVGLAIIAGSLNCYDVSGRLLWSCHPRGLNFSSIVRCDDFDRDGKKEIALQAGRPGEPYASAVLVSLATGRVIWKYDVDPMSYAWYLRVGHFLPDDPREQLVVLMQGYPPDKDNGYIALFAFDAPNKPPVQRWRYNFDHYTCFPTLYQFDLDGDGKDEIAVETHSRMWVFDPRDGKIKQFLMWDVSPANIRSYGLTEFVDLNGDGLKDFLCIANFAQHHEVLLNDHGQLKEAWHHGWNESVTVGKVSTCYPLPAWGDLLGDGKKEIVVSMFNSENEHNWMTRVYDAASGEIRCKIPGMIATTLADVDGDGAMEILADPSTDPAAWRADGSHVPAAGAGVCAIKIAGNSFHIIWQDKDAQAVRSNSTPCASITKPGQAFIFASKPGKIALKPFIAPAPPLDEKPLPIFQLPKDTAAGAPDLLAADLLGIGHPQLICYADGKATLYRADSAELREVGSYTSSALPVIADFNGDGRLDLALCDVSATHQPIVRLVTPSLANKVVWQQTLSAPVHPALPKPRIAYLRAGHFTGQKHADLYCWFGEPCARSLAIDGKTGRVLWEVGELPGDIERYEAPTQNLAAAFDAAGSGRDDLVFTAPDYYCVANGSDGKLMIGAISPQKIFNQPSQGLYTLPAILDAAAGDPTVCLCDGHYFQGAMSLHAKPMWFKQPVVGENRVAAEGFARQKNGDWLMGFGRQNGRFACVNIANGKTKWEFDVQASCTDTIACDIDGDGSGDFVFATSHGQLFAVADDGDHPRVLFRVTLPAAAIGSPIAADVLGLHKSQIIVPAADGHLLVYGSR